MTRYKCLIVSSTGQLVLAADDGAWSLPEVSDRSSWIAKAAERLVEQLRSRFALDTNILREIDGTPEVVYCEVELLRQVDGHQGLQEFSSEHPAIRVLASEDREAIGKWKADLGAERFVASWQRPGWYDETLRWIHIQLARHDMSGAVTVSRVKAAWNGSFVLNLADGDRECYFKASPERSPGEPAVLQLLVERWADHVPEVLAADTQRAWTITKAVRNSDPRKKDVRGAIRLLARLQIVESRHLADWRSIGCPEHSILGLYDRLELLLHDLPKLLHDSGIISKRDAATIQLFRADAERACRQVISSQVPAASIHHEDFRAENIVYSSGGRCVFLDWADVSITHPFFTMHGYLEFESEKDRAELTKIYLQPFAEHASPKHVEAVFQWVRALAPVQRLNELDFRYDLSMTIRNGLRSSEIEIARDLIKDVIRHISDQSLRSSISD